MHRPRRRRASGGLAWALLATVCTDALPRHQHSATENVNSTGSGGNQCAAHSTRGACLVFRHQHSCAWDAASSKCTPLIPCDQRPAKTCEYELTSGESWDRTTNLCWWDVRQAHCRFSDECFGLSQSKCAAAGCTEWRKCTPAVPGPRVCHRACTPAAQVATNSSLSEMVLHANYAPARSASNAAHPDDTAPLVKTTSGSVRGIAASQSTPERFLGIPFAEAPVGDLRWAPPKPVKWTSTLDATAMGPSCTQKSEYYFTEPDACQGYTRGTSGADGCRGYSEDCLVLNVYTPSSAAANVELRPCETGVRSIVAWSSALARLAIEAL